MPQLASLKPDLAKVQQRFAAWWENSSLGDRPLIAARELRVPGAPPAPGAQRSRAERELDPQWQLAQAEWSLAAHVRPADTLPVVCPDFANSLGIPAVFIGAELDYQPLTTWVKEMPDIYQRQLPPFSTQHPVYRALQASLMLLGEKLGSKALLSVPYMLDALTTLSLLRGAQQLCLDLVERPADVKRVCHHLDQVALDFHAAIYQTLRQWGQDQSVTWADVYAPGKVEMVQSDFCVNISPAMFDEFVFPSLKLWTDYFDENCYHLDGAEQYRFIDRFCSLPRIRSIQWQPGDMNRQPLKYLSYLKDMRRRGRAVWVMAFDTDTPLELTKAMGGPDGLMFYMRDVTLDDFNRMLERLERAR